MFGRLGVSMCSQSVTGEGHGNHPVRREEVYSYVMALTH